MEYFISVIITISCLFFSRADNHCGYKGCPKTKDEMLNVHIIPHSHMDMGWLETVDEYYDTDVKAIFDSVVSELQRKESRRFICAEMGFFTKWWHEQNDTSQEIVRNLVASGQFEFIHGGWVMNDEASAHYNEIIDQMTLGLRFLNDTFGNCGIPQVAWQIDPFGHSREQASLFAQMGYDALFFGRLDYQDKIHRMKRQEMEMIWSGSPKNLGTDSWLFTGVLYNNYDPPQDFCYDSKCGSDFREIDWDYHAESFIDVAKDWSEAYRTNHLIMPMGSDFHFSNARFTFSQIDNLIKYVNRKQHISKVNLIYSTPSCYLQEVYKANLTYSLKTDDFFPYGSAVHAMWTGYFTSRPTLKYFVHKSNNFLQACKQLAADASDDDSLERSINRIRVLAESMAVAQHHDAVSGTAKQHVTNDYAKRIDAGIKSCENVIGNAFRNMLHGNDNDNAHMLKEESAYEFCHQLNISVCASSESNDEFLLTVYNPLARTLNNSYIRVPVISSKWKVQGLNGPIFPDVIPIPDRVNNIPGRQSEADYELIFPVGPLPGLSVSYFAVTKLHLTDDASKDFKSDNGNQEEIAVDQSNDFSIENSVGLLATFDGNTGLLKTIKRGDDILNVSQNFYYYEGMSTNRRTGYKASGAYVFRPVNDYPSKAAVKVNFRVIKEQYVTEVHQKFNSWISQVIRLYDTSDTLEFEWMVGPIPVRDEIGKEIVTKYTTDMETNGVFYTDANGRELQKRLRNHRSTWKYKVHEKVAGNYYPVNSRMIISENEDLQSNDKTLILLNDRAQGGTSMNDGEMEIMLHRRLLLDDGFGVGEALNEMAFRKGLVARGKHWLIFAGKKTGISNSIHRTLAQEIVGDKIIGISELSQRKSSLHSRSTMFSQIAMVLPSNIHLLTLEPILKDTFILRLEHFYERGEDPILSKSVKIKVKDLKGAIPFIRSIRETTLAANQWKNESSRLTWTIRENSKEIAPESENSILSTGKVLESDEEVIVLNPMEIKTFLMKL